MANRTRPRLNDTEGQLRELKGSPTRLAYRLQSLLEDVIIRLERRLRAEGKDWQPTDEYLRGVSGAITAGVRLLKEIRAMSEAYKADGMSDVEIGQALQAHLQRELRDMDDAAFLQLLEVREVGNAAIPS